MCVVFSREKCTGLAVMLNISLDIVGDNGSSVHCALRRMSATCAALSRKEI